MPVGIYQHKVQQGFQRGHQFSVGSKNWAWKGGPVKRDCKVCKKEFWVKRNIINRKNGGIYCSNKCLGISRSGENSPHWKGDKVGVIGIHHWIKRQKGKAIKCQNKYCDGRGKVFHWANIDHKYKRRLDDWVELCSFCHKVFDYQTKYRFELK